MDPNLPGSRFLNLFNTYSMKTYVLLHFEHRNDVTIIVKLLYRATSHRRINIYYYLKVVDRFMILFETGSDTFRSDLIYEKKQEPGKKIS